MKLPFIATLLFLFLVGCQPSARYDTTKRPATADIDIFREGQKPTRAYKEIGVVTDDGRAVEQPTIEAKMIKKANRMGGNAVILHVPVRSGTEMAGFSAVDTFLYKATVIVYQ